MAEALSLHMENEEILKRSKDQLEMSNRQLVAEKELNQQLVQEKVAQARQNKKLIKELQVKSRSTCMYAQIYSQGYTYSLWDACMLLLFMCHII